MFNLKLIILQALQMAASPVTAVETPPPLSSVEALRGRFPKYNTWRNNHRHKAKKPN